MTWLKKFAPRKAATGPKDPSTRLIRIKENPQHPLIALFETRQTAREHAAELGAPWVAMYYACGYVLTDGWNFRDANGPVAAFCPVPIEALKTIQHLVISLQQEKVSGRELALRIASCLRSIPSLQQLPTTQFEDTCNCTLMRVCYAAPTGAKDDWLTMPPWALTLPSRRLRLT
jgi:hypothetical protein